MVSNRRGGLRGPLGCQAQRQVCAPEPCLGPAWKSSVIWRPAHGLWTHTEPGSNPASNELLSPWSLSIFICRMQSPPAPPPPNHQDELQTGIVKIFNSQKHRASLAWDDARAVGLEQGCAPCRGCAKPAPFPCWDTGRPEHVTVIYCLCKYRRASLSRVTGRVG